MESSIFVQLIKNANYFYKIFSGVCGKLYSKLVYSYFLVEKTEILAESKQNVRTDLRDFLKNFDSVTHAPNSQAWCLWFQQRITFISLFIP